MHILHFVSLIFADLIRFPDIIDPQFCPRPDSKNKKSDDYVESKGVLGLRYSTSLHYAIGHLRRADGALPSHSSGRQALALLDRSSSRFYFFFCIVEALFVLMVYFILIPQLWQILSPSYPANLRLVVLLLVEQRCWAYA